MKVLITGGTGFIGSHLCEQFESLDAEVICLDNLSTSSVKNIENLRKTKFVLGDIKDSVLINDLVSSVDLVIHLAAAVGVKTILNNPVESIQTNFVGSETVLHACNKFNKRVIIASTSEIYGKNLKQPLSETDDRVMGAPQKLRWSYADAKALEESVAHSLFLRDGLRVTTVRFFNIVGPRQSSAYGMVLPNFIENAISNKPIRVFGSGNQTRVFCHVKDVIEAMVKLINREDTIGEVFNIGGSQEISMMDLAVKVKLILSSRSNIILEPYENYYEAGFEDMIKRTPDLRKLKSFITWQPKFDLDSIIRDIAKSYSK